MESGKSIPLISINEYTGNFELEKSGIKYFNEVEHKIAILCVAGLYRTGKSLLLNLISSS